MIGGMGQLLTIGKVAQLAGVTPDTIRYYERLGLVAKAQRTAGGYRQYPEGVAMRLALVRNAQQFGFSLREIAAFLRVREAGGKPCRDVRAAGQRMLHAVDRQIADLMAARERMQATLRTWDQTLTATPPEKPALLLEALVASSPRPLSARVAPLRQRGRAAPNAGGGAEKEIPGGLDAVGERGPAGGRPSRARG
jgi:DNA-binding transcriptional MerR regulator